MSKVSKAQVLQEVEAGRVRSARHPSLPLTIFTYTEETQYSKSWNPVNIWCRALVFDDLGRQVNHPFPKFFNYEELTEEEKVKFAPYRLTTVSAKEDGSMIQVFWYVEQWVVSTKGSFSSPQAEIATHILRAHPTFFSVANKSATYLFELVGPANRNVCRHYAQDELILLAIRDEHGDWAWDSVEALAKVENFKTPLDYPIWSDAVYRKLKESADPNMEGVVLCNQDGDRCKVKTDLYVKLHRMLTNLTSHAVYEMWRDKSFTAIEGIPDEFFTEVRQQVADLELKWVACRKSVFAQWTETKELLNTLSRKDLAVQRKELTYLLTDAVNNVRPERASFRSFVSANNFTWDPKSMPWETLREHLTWDEV